MRSYCIATAPELNSSRLTSFKSRGFDSPANNVGPWPIPPARSAALAGYAAALLVAGRAIIA
jgi:hypothetical protein